MDTKEARLGKGSGLGLGLELGLGLREGASSLQLPATLPSLHAMSLHNPPAPTPEFARAQRKPPRHPGAMAAGSECDEGEEHVEAFSWASTLAIRSGSNSMW